MKPIFAFSMITGVPPPLVATTNNPVTMDSRIEFEMLSVRTLLFVKNNPVSEHIKTFSTSERNPRNSMLSMTLYYTNVGSVHYFSFPMARKTEFFNSLTIATLPT